MNIRYDDQQKDLPPEQLRRLFLLAGWSDGSETDHQRRFFNLPFVRSTLVVSAWDGDLLVDVCRVLSDQIIRSVLYDLVVDPQYRCQGIGRTLLARCVAHYPDTQWLLQTTPEVSTYYQQLGFQIVQGVFLELPSKYT